ncbi:MAG: amidase family protein [Candidatus ainarchaeum sp.]|nr:amidase family protein [Candidatus ainarchaeum sp.]
MKVQSVLEFAEQARAGNIGIEENTHKILDKVFAANGMNFFNVISKDLALQQAKELDSRVKQGKASGKLFGLPVSVKDCICVKGIESRAGSRILDGYLPVFDATVVSKAKAEGAIIIGKTSQDEFGFGTFSTNTGIGFNAPKNPFDSERSCGGSSGGSAGLTAFADFAHVSISESTGGSIACPAGFCGVAGFTPTYGLVSRYGLIDYANSLDKIGSMGKTVADSALLLESIAGHDEKDSTSLNEKPSFADEKNFSTKGLKIGIIKDFFGEGINPDVSKIAWNSIKKLEKAGAKIKEISLSLNAKFSVPAYYLIAMAESSTNLAKFCGMRYGAQESLSGSFNEYFSKVRSNNFGEEAKRRILLGTFARMSGFRDAYYLKAMKARTRLINEFRLAFKEFDVLANPTMPVIAPKFSEIEKLSPIEQYAMDLCTVPSNLAGLPHISINSGFSQKMPVGIMLVADYLQEKKLFRAASALEELQ